MIQGQRLAQSCWKSEKFFFLSKYFILSCTVDRLIYFVVFKPLSRKCSQKKFYQGPDLLTSLTQSHVAQKTELGLHFPSL